MNIRRYRNNNSFNKTILSQQHLLDEHDLNITWSSSDEEETKVKSNSKISSISKPIYKPIPVSFTKSSQLSLSRTSTSFTQVSTPITEKPLKKLINLENLSTKNLSNSTIFDDHVHSLVNQFSLKSDPSPLQIKQSIKLNTQLTPRKKEERIPCSTQDENRTCKSEKEKSITNQSSPILVYYKDYKRENKTIPLIKKDGSPVFKSRSPYKSKTLTSSNREIHNRLLRSIQNIDVNDPLARSLLGKYIRVRDKRGKFIDWDHILDRVSKYKPTTCSLLPSFSEVSDSDVPDRPTSPKAIVADETTTDESESIPNIRRKLFTSQDESINKKPKTNFQNDFIELPNTPTEIIESETQNIQILTQKSSQVNSEINIQSTVSDSKLTEPNISFINSPLSPAAAGRNSEQTTFDDTLLDSPKNGSKSKKLPPSNTLEGRMVRLLARQRSSHSMWRHEIDSGRVSSSVPSRFRVKYAWLEGTKVLVDCQHLETSELLNIQEMEESREMLKQKCTLVLDTEILGRLPKFHIGGVISIYPPWQCFSLSSAQITFIMGVTFLKHDPPSSPWESLPPWQVVLDRPEEVEDDRLPRNGHEFLDPLFNFWPGIKGNGLPYLTLLHSVVANDNCALLERTIAQALYNFAQLLLNDNRIQLEIHRYFQYRVANPEDKCILHTAVIGCDLNGEFCEITLGPTAKIYSAHLDLIDATESLGKICIFDQLNLIKRNPMKKCPNSRSLLESLGVDSDRQLFSCIFESSLSFHLREVEPETNWIRPKTLGLSSQASRVTNFLRVVHVDKTRFYAIECTKEQNIWNISEKIYSIEVASTCSIAPLKHDILVFQDIFKHQDTLTTDKYTSIIKDCQILNEIFKGQADKIYTLLKNHKTIPPMFNDKTSCKDLVTVRGLISGVDETTAFSWNFCTLCGQEQLQEIQPERFLCLICFIELTDEHLGTRMSLDIFLQYNERKVLLKIKLRQQTIESLLPSSENFKEGYEVSSLLHKAIAVQAIVQKITRKGPCSQFDLEEIESLSSD